MHKCTLSRTTCALTRVVVFLWFKELNQVQKHANALELQEEFNCPDLNHTVDLDSLLGVCAVI